MTRNEIADAVDAIDADIKALQEAKSDLFKSYRADLDGAGMAAEAIKAEVAALKAAIRRRQKVQADPEAAETVELADEIYHEITSLAPRASRETHVRVREAPETPEQAEANSFRSAPGGTDLNQGDAARLATAPDPRQTAVASPERLRAAGALSAEVSQAATPIRRDEEPEMPAFLRRSRPVASEITA